MKIIDKKSGNALEAISDENFDVTFVHPMTGKPCATIAQALSGFQEHSPESNASWDRIHQAFLNNSGNIWDFIDNDEDFTIEV